MLKVIIQIPCWNEENDLPGTLRDIPKKIKGADIVETMVIDDGSTDNTVSVARSAGVNHIVSLAKHQGLARAFMLGLDSALKLGADIIVNTDADNQYKGSDIERLIEPILTEKADLVVGDRCVYKIKHFSWIKKKLQKIGSWTVKKLSGVDVPDAVSGFRAFSREAALKMNVISNYTYTLETLIQAGQKQLKIKFVKIETNPKSRESRLITHLHSYLVKSAVTMLRIFTYYQPLKVFFSLGAGFFFSGSLLGIRYLYFQLFVPSNGEHFASLFLCVILLILSFILFMLGFLGDQIATNRHLIEDVLLRIRKAELALLKNPDNKS